MIGFPSFFFFFSEVFWEPVTLRTHRDAWQVKASSEDVSLMREACVSVFVCVCVCVCSVFDWTHKSARLDCKSLDDNMLR